MMKYNHFNHSLSRIMFGAQHSLDMHSLSMILVCHKHRYQWTHSRKHEQGNEEDESVPKSNTPAGTPNPADAKTNTNTNTNSDEPTTSSGNKEDPDFAALSSYIKKLEKELKVSVDISEQVILSFYSLAMPVSYTHLTLPTICSV